MPTEPDGFQPDLSKPLRRWLREALPATMKARDRVAVAALRSTLAAIDNAEAVDRAAGIDERLAIEQIPTGVAATEAQRQILTEGQVRDIVRAEVFVRETAARTYEQAGQQERAALLRSEASVLSAHLAGA